MNMKEMMVSIITAMVVVAMFASSAAAITVDGTASTGEWTASDKLCDDPSGDTCSTGYDITSLWAHIEGGTAYFRIDVSGVPGDADNDGDPDTHTNGMNCSCDWDYPGIGEGVSCDKEQYYIEIDKDNDGNIDYILKYCSGDSYLYGPSGTTPIAGATTNEAYGGIVEISVNIDQYCEMNPANYCVEGWADTQCNGNEDHTDQVCRTDNPPNAVCNFTSISCGQGTLNGTGSSDDGTIVDYAWDFYNDGTYDAHGITVPYNIIGTHDVRLMVTDNLGQTANCTLSVTLTDNPVADAKADGSDGPVDLPSGGENVTFTGTASGGAPPYTCTWNIGGTTYSGIGPHVVLIDHPLTATLTVVDNIGCTGTDTVRIRVPTTKNHKVPIMTPAGMLALIGLLGIVGGSRILRRGRRS